MTRRSGAAAAGGRLPVGRSTGTAAMAAAVLRYYQMRFAGPATRISRHRIRLALLGLVLAVVAITVLGLATGNPWWGPIAVLAAGMVLLLVGLLLALVAVKRLGVFGPGSVPDRPPRPPAPLRGPRARPGVISTEERTKIETLEQLYLHRKAVVDRSSNPDLGPEADAWSDMIEAKVKVGLCGWPRCRNRDFAYSFCAEHDPRRTGRKGRVS